jgi:hypothetical protein
MIEVALVRQLPTDDANVGKEADILDIPFLSGASCELFFESPGCIERLLSGL